MLLVEVVRTPHSIHCIPQFFCRSVGKFPIAACWQGVHEYSYGSIFLQQAV